MERQFTNRPVDWVSLQAKLRRELARHVRVDESVLDDLVQEASVRLLRVQRKSGGGDLEQFIPVLAHRAAMDHLRSIYRHRALREAAERGEVEAATVSVGDPVMGDLLVRLELVVLEIFQEEGRAQCRALALAWFSERDWRRIADSQGISHSAARKRWSRCLEWLRLRIHDDDRLGPIMRWSVES